MWRFIESKMRFTDILRLGVRYFHVQESFELVSMQFSEVEGNREVFQQRRALIGEDLDNAAKSCFPPPAAQRIPECSGFTAY